MPKLLTVLFLAILATLTACSGPTPVPDNPDPPVRPVTTQVPAPTRAPAPTKPPTEKPTAAPTETPADSPAPEHTPTPTAIDDSAASGITLLAMDDPETLASELSDSEEACLAGIADAEGLIKIFTGPVPLTPEERTLILACLEQETLIQIYLGGSFRDSEPLSGETAACLRTVLQGIDFRSWMLLLRTQDEMDETANIMLVSGFWVTIACLDQEEWESIAVIKNLHPGDRKDAQCFLAALGGLRRLTAALEAGNEGDHSPLFTDAAKHCGNPFEDSWKDTRDDIRNGPKAGLGPRPKLS